MPENAEIAVLRQVAELIRAEWRLDGPNLNERYRRQAEYQNAVADHLDYVAQRADEHTIGRAIVSSAVAIARAYRIPPGRG